MRILNDALIKKEKSRLKRIFTRIPEDKKKVLEPLIEEAAFLKAALMESKETLKEEGLSVLTENSNQKFVKAHPLTKVYSDYVRQYNAIINGMIAYLPEPETKKESRLKALMRDNE